MLYCKEPIQRVGPVKEGQPCHIVFKVENTGEETYTNLQPWKSCGCSEPTVLSSTIKPGEIIGLHVEFDTLGRPGINEKSVGLYYGDKNKLTVKFIAEVIK